MRLGILSGVFDPIHFGHLKIAEFCQKKLTLDIVLFIPSGNPPHKKAVADYRHRLKMVELAVKDYDYFIVSELERKTSDYRRTYSINTLKKVKRLYPEVEIFFFIGEDNVSEIPKWYNYKELFNYAKFVVLSRNVAPCNRTKIITRGRKSWDNLDYYDKLKFLNTPKIDISSNMIRNNIAKNLSIDGLLPKVVENYIKENSCYSATKAL